MTSPLDLMVKCTEIGPCLLTRASDESVLPLSRYRFREMLFVSTLQKHVDVDNEEEALDMFNEDEDVGE